MAWIYARFVAPPSPPPAPCARKDEEGSGGRGVNWRPRRSVRAPGPRGPSRAQAGARHCPP
eukprot:scaffold2441_cov413-Prasinococcus_capsulatus_cf.AAC.8